jgi:hypothetical protein
MFMSIIVATVIRDSYVLASKHVTALPSSLLSEISEIFCSFDYILDRIYLGLRFLPNKVNPRYKEVVRAKCVHYRRCPL